MTPSITHRAVLLIALAGLVSIGWPTLASSTTSQCRFDPNGNFYLRGGSPKSFEEFDHIQLQVPDKSGESRLIAKNGTSYKFASLGEFETHSSGSGITFEFTTKSIRGVNYQFSGKFTSICVLAKSELDPGKVVAQGRLLKFKNRKQKAAADVELTYSESPRQQKSSEATDDTGREVLAIVTKIELKAYTDDLGNGKVVVSDVIRFEIVEPKELEHVTVSAYYQGVPNVEGKRLQVRDLVRFKLPSEPQRAGILLGDLKNLRLRDAKTS